VVIEIDVPIVTDHLARAVDAPRDGAVNGRGIIERDEGATAFEEAVDAGGVLIGPDDLVRIIDAECLGGAGKARGIVEGIEGIDWHDTGFSVIVSLAGERRLEKLSRNQTCSA
jgi:hypothetical protein